MPAKHLPQPVDVFPRRLTVNTNPPSLADVAVERASASDVRSLARLLDLNLEATPEEVCAVAELRILQLESIARGHSLARTLDAIIVDADSHGPVTASRIREIVARGGR
jgi:hypothetical protein